MPTELTEYEAERLANIALNKARLIELGIQPLPTPAPKGRSVAVRRLYTPPKEGEPGNRSDRTLRSRVSASTGELSSPKVSPPRASPRHESNASDPSSPSDREREYDTPPRVKRARPAHAQHKLAPLEPAHYKQLADGLDSTEWAPNLADHWIDDMDNNFLDNPSVYLAYCGRVCSYGNRRSIVNALKRMSRSDGTEHPYNRAAPPFKAGAPLTADSDTEQLLAEAEDWLAKYGEDKGHGWLLTHPLRKMRLYQDWKVFGLNSADPAGHLHEN